MKTKAPFISVPDHPKWNAHHSQLYPMLGLKAGQHLPDEGLAPRVIQGIKVWVIPKCGSGGAHRVRAECPRCGKVLSAGRLFQHTC